MPRSLKSASQGAALACLALVGFTTCAPSPEVWERVPGDVEPAGSRTDPEELLAEARAFLATGRPWRASQVMRRYFDLEARPVPEARLLAARAEAGWGAWAEVHGLLEGRPALDTWDDGLGLYLLGRARDELDDVPGAVSSYREFLALSPPAGELDEERAVARLRLGLALVRAGEREAAREELRVSSARAGQAAPWLALLEAGALAATGDTAAVRRATTPLENGIPGLLAWRARIEAARKAGDPRVARRTANEARAWARTDLSRAEFFVHAGRAALDMGDVAGGRAAFRDAIDLNAATPYAREASELLQAGEMSPADHLAVARVYRAQGLYEESVEGFRVWLAASLGTAAERTTVHVEHADALFYAERYDEVRRALGPVLGETAAQNLLARAEAHLGNADEAVRIYLAQAQRFAGTGSGAQALLLAAGTRHDENDFRRARELYGDLVRRYSATDQAGLATMRMAGMAFHEGDHAEAARLWDAYRSRSPGGTYALQATYWSGRARELMGERTAAAALFRAVRERARDSYYAVLASERLGESFWPLPMSAAPPDSPAAAERVRGWMRGVDLLRHAGFPDVASAEADRVVERAGQDPATLYALGEALAERGYTQRAIRIGLILDAREPANRRLYRLLFPFPYRTLITEEARDRELDPFVVAGLIRQESMFEARITSPAGARGLMQVMPRTGRRLAEAAGLDRWDAELLYHPEINVHLGTRYVAQHSATYDGSLPSVFSAYNAGAHRVDRWREFEEHEREELFTERIPFRETRDYVKILTRNLAIYRGLYGGQGS